MGQKWPIFGGQKGVIFYDLRSFLRKKRFFHFFWKNEIFSKIEIFFQKITFSLKMSTNGLFWTPKMGQKSTHFGGPKWVFFQYLRSFLRKTLIFQKSRNFWKILNAFLKNERKKWNFQNFNFCDKFFTLKMFDKILKISKKTENFRFFSKFSVFFEILSIIFRVKNIEFQRCFEHFFQNLLYTTLKLIFSNFWKTHSQRCVAQIFGKSLLSVV